MRYRDNNRNGRAGAGFTLIEVVMAIVVLAIGVTAFLPQLLTSIKHSGDPMLQEQANAIAQSYLEEILLKPFCDPSVTDCPAACNGPVCSTPACNPDDAGSRPLYEDICDYRTLNDTAGAIDQSGAVVSGLEDYNVAVTIDDTATLNGLTGATGQTAKVKVTVTHDGNSSVNVSLEGYKANY